MASTSSNNYSDLEYKFATDITGNDKVSTAFKQLQIQSKPTTMKNICDTIARTEGSSADDVLKDILRNSDQADRNKIMNWKIVSVFDNNSVTTPGHTGCYGNVIDTGTRNPIISFRGTEPGDFSKLLDDLDDGDFSLLKSTQTAQQNDVGKYMQILKNEGILDQYNSFDFAGHSLGGNDSLHAAIVLSEMGYGNKVSDVVLFDAPGNSNEYWNLHKNEMNEIRDRIKLYAWSPIGELLHPAPGASREHLQADGSSFGKHDTVNLHFSSSGSATRGQADSFDVALGKVSKDIDNTDPFVGGFLASVLSTSFTVTRHALQTHIGMFDTFAKEYELRGKRYHDIWTFDVDNPLDGALKVGGALLATAGQGLMDLADHALFAVGVAGTFVFGLAGAAGSLLATLALGLLAATEEYFKEMGKMIGDFIVAAGNWIGDRINEFANAVIGAFNAFGDWWDRTFNPARQYVESHCEILVDTLKLDSYRDRLMAVNRRLEKVDKRLDGLYWKVDLLQNGTVQSADMGIGYDNGLKKCCDYLARTAYVFAVADDSLRDMVAEGN